MAKKAEYKKLLREAESQIVQLQAEKQDLNEYVKSQSEAQKGVVKELERLVEKMRKLDKALKDITAERDDVRLLLMGLRDDMEKIRVVAADTLNATKDKESILKMAVQFYEVKTLADSVAFIKDD